MPERAPAVAVEIFGGVAIHFYLADILKEKTRNTRDLDFAGEPALMKEVFTPVFKLKKDVLQLDKIDVPLSMFFKAPNWRLNLVSMTEKMGLSHMSVNIFHPFDLIVSKMTRALPKDVEDIELLLNHILWGKSDSLDVYCADSYRYLTESEAVVFKQAFEDIFDKDFDLSKYEDELPPY